MFERAKYITFTDPEFGVSAVVFPSSVRHDFMAQSLRLMRDDILGAGFWNGKECVRNSESLRKESRKEDTDIVRKLING